MVCEASRISALYFFISIFAIVISCVFQRFRVLTMHGKLNKEIPGSRQDRNCCKGFDQVILNIFNLNVSKKRFSNFYFLGIFVTIYCLYTKYPHYMRLSMFLIHNIRRYMEEKYLCVHNTKYSRMGLFVFVYGLSYYVMMPISIAVIPDFHNETAVYQILFFLFFSFFQFNSHLILAEIKKKSLDYAIPFGGLFRFVSCPHYLCEIGIYFSLLFDVLSDINYLHIQLAMIYVVVCMFVNAIRAHYWYINQFNHSYLVLRRKSIIPFIF